MDSEIAQRGNSLRQKSLSARLINRRSSGVDNNGTKSSLIAAIAVAIPAGPAPMIMTSVCKLTDKSMCCNHRMPASEAKLS